MIALPRLPLTSRAVSLAALLAVLTSAALILAVAALGADRRLCLVASTGLSLFVLCYAVVLLGLLRRENARLRRALTIARLLFQALAGGDAARRAGRSTKDRG